jgi:dihydroorotate dehydrogenase (fumarate)
MNLTTSYLGLNLAHPIIPGASPLCDNLDQVRRLEDAGAPAIVMHSLFEEQILQEGIAHQLFRESVEEGFSEAASFFPAPSEFVFGPEQYLEQIARIKKAVAIPVIASLNGSHPGGWVDYAKRIQEAGAAALELNIYFLPSDPGVPGIEVESRLLKVVQSVKAAVKIPVAVKLSPFYSSLPHLAGQLHGIGADALILFNRFYQPDFDVENLEVRARLELSSPAELQMRLHWTAILAGRVPLPIVVGGGVHSYTDAVKALMAGATAVQVVSCLLKKGPEYLAVLVRELKQFMEEQDYRSLDQMRGSLSLKHCPNPDAFERTNYLRTLQLWRV